MGCFSGLAPAVGSGPAGKLNGSKGSKPYFLSAASVIPSPSESVRSTDRNLVRSFGAVGFVQRTVGSLAADDERADVGAVLAGAAASVAVGMGVDRGALVGIGVAVGIGMSGSVGALAGSGVDVAVGV